MGDAPHRLSGDLYPVLRTVTGGYAVADDGGPFGAFADARREPLLIPDGGFCWQVFPDTNHDPGFGSWFMVVPFSVLRKISDNPIDGVATVFCWLSWVGHDFSADDPTVVGPTVLGAVVPQAHGFTDANEITISNFFLGIYAPASVTIAPGSTITARVALQAGDSLAATECVNLSYTVPAYCYGYPVLGGGGM